jgi:cation transport ATPase
VRPLGVTPPDLRPLQGQRRAWLRRVVRWFLLGLATLVLLVVAWGALSGAVRQFPRSDTVAQKIETAVQLACGFLSLLGVLTTFVWQRSASRILPAWAASLAAAAGLSALVWGPPQPAVALLFAAVALLVALGVIRLLRKGLAT